MGSMLGDSAFAIVAFAFVLPAYASSSRRLHDANMSGARLLIALIPFAGLLVLYWMCKAPVDPNDYND